MERPRPASGNRAEPDAPLVWSKAPSAANSNQMVAEAKARIKELALRTDPGVVLAPPPKPPKPRSARKKTKEVSKKQPAGITAPDVLELVAQEVPESSARQTPATIARELSQPASLDPAPRVPAALEPAVEHTPSIPATRVANALPEPQPQPSIDIVLPVEPATKSRPKGFHLDALHLLTLAIALGLATVAAYFSVTGMSKIFPGSVTAIIVMASTMEAGKLIGAAWLSRYWRDMSWLLRGVLTALVTVLAATNAVGVFGQLSAAHLGPHVTAMTASETEAAEANARVDAQNNVIADLTRRINQIDAAIDAATKHGRGVSAMELSRDQRKNRAELVQQRTAAETALIQLKTDQARAIGDQQMVQADVGILEYAATLFGIDRERMIQLLIFAMVLSCDPLSITLVVATAGRRRKIAYA